MKRDHVIIRPFEWDDLPAMVEVANRSIECNQEDQYVTLESLQENFNRPYFYPLANCFVALVDGRVVGYTTAELDPRNGQGWGVGYVHPDVRRQGIGTALLRRADARHRERAPQELPAGMPIVCTRYTRDVNTPAVTLLENEGYHVARVTWFMRMKLDVPLAPPNLPEGITLRPFNLERDAYAVYEATNEFFKDNWGFVALPYDVWGHYNLRPQMDESLWLVALDGDQIAGICLCRPWGEGEPGLGWVAPLGVRSNWRKKGLGSALLRYGFYRLQERGYTAVGLDVDSENKTNAVGLYEHAGMH
ncbi:partial Mycothiol acetyltransferase, partial [Anaerolineae bacterium]